ncbi:hypothetical protein IWX46DRAFT_225918 [Phyllosticta citricarpa]|uniref:Uncharacterized protein n=1 Tax=Phyllosticta citricarpa TaxID=55181 RepID=A0ABR1MNR6_9PEZI
MSSTPCGLWVRRWPRLLLLDSECDAPVRSRDGPGAAQTWCCGERTCWLRWRDCAMRSVKIMAGGTVPVAASAEGKQTSVLASFCPIAPQVQFDLHHHAMRIRSSTRLRLFLRLPDQISRRSASVIRSQPTRYMPEQCIASCNAHSLPASSCSPDLWRQQHPTECHRFSAPLRPFVSSPRYPSQAKPALYPPAV